MINIILFSTRFNSTGSLERESSERMQNPEYYKSQISQLQINITLFLHTYFLYIFVLK